MSATPADVTYFAEILKSNSNSIAPLVKKMHDAVDSLPYEDLYVLRELMTRNAVLIDLLNETIAAEAAVTPKPRWKTILRRK